MRIDVTLSCRESAEACLERLREVLVPIEAAREPWPVLVEWERLLPRWFVTACSVPMTQEEAQLWVERWRTLPPEQQAEASASKRWSLPDWLYWMEPGHLLWKWVGAEVRTSHELGVWLEVDGWPIALGAFEWLARAAGATATKTLVW